MLQMHLQVVFEVPLIEWREEFLRISIIWTNQSHSQRQAAIRQCSVEQVGTRQMATNPHSKIVAQWQQLRKPIDRDFNSQQRHPTSPSPKIQLSSKPTKRAPFKRIKVPIKALPYRACGAFSLHALPNVNRNNLQLPESKLNHRCLKDPRSPRPARPTAQNAPRKM